MIEKMLTCVGRAKAILEGLFEMEHRLDNTTVSELRELFGAVRHHLDHIWQFEEPEFEPPKSEFDWWDIQVVRPLEYAMNDFNPDDAPINPDLWRIRAFACARKSYSNLMGLYAELSSAVRIAESRRLRGIKYAPTTVEDDE